MTAVGADGHFLGPARVVECVDDKHTIEEAHRLLWPRVRLSNDPA